MRAIRINSTASPHGAYAVSRIDPRRDPVAFFERLKLGFLQWATELPDGRYSLLIYANTPDREHFYIKLFLTHEGDIAVQQFARSDSRRSASSGIKGVTSGKMQSAV